MAGFVFIKCKLLRCTIIVYLLDFISDLECKNNYGKNKIIRMERLLSQQFTGKNDSNNVPKIFEDEGYTLTNSEEQPKGNEYRY